MRKLYTILVFSVLLSGCATYKFQKAAPADQSGFVVTRYNKAVPEYTLGANNSFPDKELAEERFRRRRPKVEYYYKKMGFMDNRFKQDFVEPPLAIIQFIAGIFRMPFIAVSDYKYNHNPQYKERMDKLEDEQYNAERERIKKLKEELSEYIKQDLTLESPAAVSGQPKPKEEADVAAEEVPAAPAPEVKPAIKPPEQEKAVVPEEPKTAAVVEQPKAEEIKTPLSLALPSAVISAKPQNGPSPLKVNFSGRKSSSPNGRIISYDWDFGDGDKSNKPNPTNTYWSTTYGAREFTVTLTVTDNKGITSSSSVSIQVINK